MDGLTIACIALTVATTNAAFSIFNICMSRFRFIAVQEIQTVSGASVDSPFPYRAFSIDLVSYGASVWDTKVVVEIELPTTAPFLERTLVGRIDLVFTPARMMNPFNAGQSMRFELRESAKPNEPMHILKMCPKFDEVASQIPSRNISLRIYCNDGSKLLKTIKSSELRWSLDGFMCGIFKAKQSFRHRRAANKRIKQMERQFQMVRTMQNDRKK